MEVHPGPLSLRLLVAVPAYGASVGSPARCPSVEQGPPSQLIMQRGARPVLQPRVTVRRGFFSAWHICKEFALFGVFCPLSLMRRRPSSGSGVSGRLGMSLSPSNRTQTLCDGSRGPHCRARISVLRSLNQINPLLVPCGLGAWDLGGACW